MPQRVRGLCASAPTEIEPAARENYGQVLPASQRRPELRQDGDQTRCGNLRANPRNASDSAGFSSLGQSQEW
jgi:hypothetical protein